MPIELAIADVERWLDALDRERDRAARLLATLKGVRQDPPLVLAERPTRVLPHLVLQMATARTRRSAKRGA